MDEEEKKKFFRKEIMEWGNEHIRYYPWRIDRSVYGVFISELLLQRTKADQVKPVYEKILQKYPTIEDLTKASVEVLEDILKPLGLIKRSLYLRQILVKYLKKGESLDALSDEFIFNLPGIGKYTLNAFKCFGKSKKVAIVDSNIIRIFSRFFPRISKKKQPRNDPELWNFATELLPDSNFVHFNYALIDFGSLQCTFRNPKCDSCPLITNCFFISQL